MNDFVVVANRLPVDLHYDDNGAPVWTPSPGGLVAALTPVLAQIMVVGLVGPAPPRRLPNRSAPSRGFCSTR